MAAGLWPSRVVVVLLAGEPGDVGSDTRGRNQGHCPDRALEPDTLTHLSLLVLGGLQRPLQLQLPLSPAPHGDPDLDRQSQLRKLPGGASLWTRCETRPATARTCQGLPRASIARPPRALAGTGLPPGPTPSSICPDKTLFPRTVGIYNRDHREEDMKTSRKAA